MNDDLRSNRGDTTAMADDVVGIRLDVFVRVLSSLAENEDLIGIYGKNVLPNLAVVSYEDDLRIVDAKGQLTAVQQDTLKSALSKVFEATLMEEPK